MRSLDGRPSEADRIICQREIKSVSDDLEDFLAADDAAPLRSEARGFSHDQMVTCEACLRANPPTRASCLYCAAALPQTEASAALRKPTLRRLEKWEQGVSCILLPEEASSVTADRKREIAMLLRLELEDVSRILDARAPLPVAYAANDEEASIVERSLKALGVGVLNVPDQALELESARPKRIRWLGIAEDTIVSSLAGGGAELLRKSWDEVSLIVAGRLFSKRVEFEEKRGRKSEKEIMDARELSEDVPVLDIYTAQSNDNWRILGDSFDFSCLGDKKRLVASENFHVLAEMLRERARHALFDDSYNRVRRALTPVWPLEQHTESRGWKRAGVGRFNTEAATTSDNEAQFTRYSRLQNYLRRRHES
jgi:hypothetical protein